MPTQMTFHFKSLDFQGLAILTVDDIAGKLGRTARHVINLIDNEELTAINTSVKEDKRKNYRIPIEGWFDFIIRRLSGPSRKEFLEGLPRETLEEVFEQLKKLLAA